MAGMPYPTKALKPNTFTRFATDAKRGDAAGFCKIFDDGTGAVFGDFRQGTSFTWQQRDDDRPAPSQEERHALKRKADVARQHAEIEREQGYSEAAEKASSIWKSAKPADPDHAYLRRKGIRPHIARQDEQGRLILPIYGAEEKIQSIQFISGDGSKQFLKGGKVAGGYAFIGTTATGEACIVAEGFATGASIHEATEQPIAIAFSGSNMAKVAAVLKAKYPRSKPTIAGDLDASGAGLKYAQAAAKAAGIDEIVLPAFRDGRESGDFNDAHAAEGLDAVRRLFESKSTPIKFSAPALPGTDSRDGTGNTRPLTEFGNAQRLHDRHGANLRYVPGVTRWLNWDGFCWEWDGDGAGIRARAAGLASAIYDEGRDHLRDAEHFAKWARASSASRTINAAVSLLSDFENVRLPLGFIDTDPLLAGIDHARQIIDLKTGIVRPARQNDYITKSLNTSHIGDAAKSALWMNFLDQIFNGDRELIDWLQRWCGYLLTGSTEGQFFVFAFGLGANGKSVFAELLKHIMGDYARAIAVETLTETRRNAGSASPDLHALIGARLALSTETEDGCALAESLVKSLVAGDSMSTRALYQSQVEFTPMFKLLMLGNHRPIIRGNDYGIWRRVRLLPFNRVFAPDERDLHLLEKLKAEAPHILAWMVAGCIAWRQKGLADTPAVIEMATADYRVEQDLIGTWLTECCDAARHLESASSELYACYRNWAIDNGLKPASSTALGRRLSERGFHKRKSCGAQIWQGISTKSAYGSSYASAKGHQ